MDLTHRAILQRHPIEEGIPGGLQMTVKGFQQFRTGLFRVGPRDQVCHRAIGIGADQRNTRSRLGDHADTTITHRVSLKPLTGQRHRITLRPVRRPQLRQGNKRHGRRGLRLAPCEWEHGVPPSIILENSAPHPFPSPRRGEG